MSSLNKSRDHIRPLLESYLRHSGLTGADAQVGLESEAGQQDVMAAQIDRIDALTQRDPEGDAHRMNRKMTHYQNAIGVCPTCGRG